MRLKDVTAICVDTQNHALAAKAASICAAHCDFADVVLLSDQEAGFPIRKVEKLRGIADYNRFVLDRIVEFVDSDYALVFQWDGFVVNPERWTDEFRRFDYIGAPWNDAHVGNGGFSFRSRRLLERTKGLATNFDENEDGTLRWDLIPKIADEGFIVAPVDLASRFSFELLPPPADKSFGFHGDFNFAKVLSEEELRDVIELSSERFWDHRRPFRWIEGLVRLDDREKASRMLALCMDLRPAETRQWLHHNTL